MTDVIHPQFLWCVCVFFFAAAAAAIPPPVKYYIRLMDI